MIRGLGEDGEAISGLMPTLEQQFARLGLTLKKDENTFLSTYEIMEQLSEVWDDISDFERANILNFRAIWTKFRIENYSNSGEVLLG